MIYNILYKMDIVKAFNENNLHTEIVIKGTIDQPLFRSSDIGQVLDMSNIRATIMEFDETEKVVNTIDTPGGAQQVSFLTEKGLYKVLFRSRKPIAQKFQNWVCEVIKEIRLKGVYDLQKQLEQHKTELEQMEDKKKQEYEAKLEKEKVLEKQKMLLKEYGSIGSIVYIIRVKTCENGQYIVKIGESRKGITNRYNEHKSKYDECLLLDCFCVNKSKDFESFLHHHETIRPNRITDLKGHENENELFLIGKNLTYQMILNIITNNINYFNGNDNSKLELEVEKLKLMLEMKETSNENPLLLELLNLVKTLSNKVDNLEKINKQLLEKANTSSIKTSTGFKEPLATLGPRLQKINPENLQIVTVYESASEAMKEDNKIKRPSLNKSVMENTVYNGYRWLFVDRELDPDIIHNIQATKKTKVQKLGYIAQLNSEQTEIINVYLDRKTAAFYNGYASLDYIVLNNTISNGFYYKLYDKLDNHLKQKFIEKIGEEPNLYKNGLGQFDKDNNLIREFVCKYDCIRLLKISDKTLSKALTKNIEYNGFYYKELGSKLKIH
jgi:prophage antirepressor-like protein